MTANNQYPGLYQHFQWLVPARFHLADACCERWAAQGLSARHIALYLEDADGRREVWTFERLHHDAMRLAHALLRMGLQPGDRVAILLPPQGEFLVSLLAAWHVGAIAVPLSTQLDATLLERCLRDSGSRVAITQSSTYARLLPGLHRCTSLQQIIGINLHNDRAVPWRGLLARQPAHAAPRQYAAEALLLYDTQPGTPPRGLLHGHAALLGALSGFVAAHNWFPQHASSYWVGLDWALPAALLGGVLPCLYFGQALAAQKATLPVVAQPGFLARHGVSHLLTTPLVLHQLRRALQQQPQALPHLHTIVSTGQALGPALASWYAQHLGLAINNAYSPTGMPLLAGQSHSRWADPPDSLGRPYPGHRLQPLNPDGTPAPPGQVGDLVVWQHDTRNEPDPAWWYGQWPDRAGATQPWRSSGDLATLDADGRLWWCGRQAHLIHTEHGPLNPEQLEAVLLEHPAVAEVGIVALSEAPDPLKLKAWVVALPGRLAADVADDILALGRRGWPAAARDAAWVLDFTEALPRQPSGRLQRAALRARDRSRRRRSRKAA